MSDRELLEMAAKAAGLTIWKHGKSDGGFINNRAESWSPLTHDGDALRLAVKLQLTICNEHVSAGSAYCTASGYGFDCNAPSFPEVNSGANESDVIPEDYAATRRAIVLAAAQIGAAMP